MPRRALACVVACVFACEVGCIAACARTDKLADVAVQSASLDHLVALSIDVVGGGTYATADLHIVEPGGLKLDVPLQIEGGEVGPLMAMNMGKLDFGEGAFDLSHVSDAHGDDLLGPYSGYSVQTDFFAGYSYYELENDRRARLKLGGFDLDLGMSMFVGQEWLNFDVAPPDAGPATDAGTTTNVDGGDGDIDGDIDGGQG